MHAVFSGNRIPARSVALGLAALGALGGVSLLAAKQVLGAVAPGKAASAPKDVLGKKITPFTLADSTGKRRSYENYRDKKAVVLVFLSADCPMAQNYAPALSEIQTTYGPQGVQVLGINAMPDEDLTKIDKQARDYKLVFPVLKDVRQSVASELGALVTPEVFVLDQSGSVRYRGRIDDAFVTRTQKRQKVQSRELVSALEAVLAGKPVATPYSLALGCAIPKLPAAAATTPKVTYHGQVSRILQEQCQSCHRPGQVGPFTLTSYADAKRWAQEIKVFTTSRQMPPWQAEPGHGDFADSRRMSDEQVKTLVEWVDAGAPEGNPTEAPAPKEWPADWMLGEPDLVLKMPEPMTIEATGEDIFRCFVLPTGLTEDKFVTAVEIKPGNGRVLHHVINFLENTGRARQLDEKDPGPGYNGGPGGIGTLPSGALGGWAPGNFPRHLPDGVGMPLPKGSDIVMQVHYHKTGKVETDQTSIGLYFAKKPIEKQFRLYPLTNFNIKIPPGAERHEVRASMPLLFDVDLLNVLPHMHLLGKEMKVTATLPDGSEKDLIWIKNWDYRWQDTYRYREPMRLPKGTKLNMVATFDNSASNPNNPSSPPKLVTFGEQTTDEMAFAFLGFTMVNEPKTNTFGLRGLLGLN